MYISNFGFHLDDNGGRGEGIGVDFGKNRLNQRK